MSQPFAPQILTLEQLGLYSEQTTPLRTWPSAVVYGGAGSGKSTEFCVGFQEAQFVKTAKTVTRPYYSWLRSLNKMVYERAWYDFAAVNSSQTNHPLFKDYADQAGLDAVGRITGNRPKLSEMTLPSDWHNWSTINQWVSNLVAARKSGHTLPICGVVFDEFTEILRRVYVEMQTSGMFRSKKGGDNDWAVQDACEEWLLALCNMFRDNGLLLGMVCQEAPPVFHKDSTEVKYKGGPETPIGRLRETICRAPDICVRITLKNGMGMGMTAPGASSNGLGLPPGSAPLGLPPPMQGAAPQAQGAPQAQVAQNAPPPSLGGPPAKVATPDNPQVILQNGQALVEVPPERWVERFYWTEVHPLWNSKWRDFSVGCREPLGFRRLIERGGYI